jgi:hypothetical protein
MAVVNNAGGNKLDAYLKVHTDYRPGTCVQDVRVGSLTVTLDNTAPDRGLPAYVIDRADLRFWHIRNRQPGSNRIAVDLYGPVGAQAPAVTLDGVPAPVISGTDRGHAVWRVDLPISPGQTRTLQAVVVQPLGLGGQDSAPQVLVQPMAIPATATVVPGDDCTAS